MQSANIAALMLAASSVVWAAKVEVHWEQVQRVSNTTATLQVVVNPPLRRGSAIHDRAFAELKRLGADYVRFVPWMPYPRLAVAELEPPAKGRTSWDFSLIDPVTLDFLHATSGHPVILNFSTIPAWMFKSEQPVAYPQDPDEADWHYTQGTELRDPSGKELGEYYARLVSWFTQGGFTDELGVRHESGHHFPVDYWEVLNEVESEHSMTPEQYTERYDAIVSAIRRVAPAMKFVGITIGNPAYNPRMFEYFLNPANHRPGIPLDMISYHFYTGPSEDQPVAAHAYTFFAKANGFIAVVRYIEQIRQRLSPSTKTTINEIGSILPGDPQGGRPIPNSYWNLSGATFAYLFGNLASLGIDIVGESQLVGYPTQFPSVSMLDWNNGAPNARFRILELLKTNFGPGDKIVKTSGGDPNVYQFAVVKPSGERKILLVSERDRDIEIDLPAGVTEAQYVDQTTMGGTPARVTLSGGKLTLRGFSVAVVNLGAH